MADLMKIGKIFVLIDGLIVIINALLGFLHKVIDVGFDIGTGQGAKLVGDELINSIIVIIIGVIFVFIFLGRIKIKDPLVLGIVVLVLAIMFTTWIGILGGILILLEKFL